MAQRVQVLLIDDISGGEAAETVTFALDGVTYEIDLSAENAKKLRDDLAEWVGHARRSGGRRAAASGTSPRRSGGAAARNELAKMREWGRENGFKVSDRGRVSTELMEAYQKAAK